jgi:cell shape-determining protein MreC
VSGSKSSVRLITDRGFSVGVAVQGVPGAGVAHGQGDPQRLRADGFDINTELKDGQLLQTAGTSGSPYPSGIPVGTIESVSDDNASMQKTADVKLVSSVDNLTYVTVLLYQPGS